MIRMRITQDLGLISVPALHFIRRLLSQDPDKRPTVQEALADEWLSVNDGFVYIPYRYSDDNDDEEDSGNGEFAGNGEH